MEDELVSDDVFESPSSKSPMDWSQNKWVGLGGCYYPPSAHELKVRLEELAPRSPTPSPTKSTTGYPGYNYTNLSFGTSLVEERTHKTILVGDSGVGKTSLLVQFDTKKFQPGSFAATVGIGFTVMLLGDSAVGKTCLLVRFRDGTFLSGTFIATVGIDFRNKLLDVDGAKVKLQIWDTAGQERFRSVTHAYYRDAHALLLLYDVTNRTSYDNTRAWLAEISEYANQDVIIMLIGNKCDCSDKDRAVKHEDGERLANEYQVAFMETSAKTGVNVDSAFQTVARALLHKLSLRPLPLQSPTYVPATTKTNCACPTG